MSLWYLLTIVFSLLLRLTDSDCLYGIYWPLCCLSFFDLRILIAPMVYIGHYVVCPSFKVSDWPYGIYWLFCCLSLDLLILIAPIYWPLRCLSFDLRIIIVPMVSIGHCVVCPSSTYGFCFSYGIYWPLCCLSFFDLRILLLI